MASNGVKTAEDADMADCDGENIVTMMDVLQEQEDFEEDANAVLGASDDKNCTYPKGYVKRQAIYACQTCCPDARMDPTMRAGVCLACSLNCHENHELIELYTKRNFRCDCGNPKFNSHPCQFTPNKTDLNYENRYNQNFIGVYCTCHRPYPDPESPEEDEMIQCIICEDWLHTSHLNATVPVNDHYAEMVCKDCMEDNDFLNDYSHLVINIVDKEVAVIDPDLDVNIPFDTSASKSDLVNGKTEAETDKVNEENQDVIKGKTDKISEDTDNNKISEDMDDNRTSEDLDNNEIEEKDSNEKESSDINMTETEPDESGDKSDLNLNKEEDRNDEQTEKKQEENAKKIDASEVKSDDKTDADTKNETKFPCDIPDSTVNTVSAAEAEGNKEAEDKKQNEGLIDTENSIVEKSDENKSELETKVDNPDQQTVDKMEEDRLLQDETETSEKQDEAEPSEKEDEKSNVDGDASSNIENVGEKDIINTEVPVDQEPTNEENSDITENKTETDVDKIPTNDLEIIKADSNTTDDKLDVTSESTSKTESPARVTENKRKCSDEDSTDNNTGKKPKLDTIKCVRPRGVKGSFNGATFWPSNFRQKLCTCNECISMYKDLAVLFLTDPDDTVTAYEALGKERIDGAPSQYEKGLQALSSLGRVQQINALTEYNKMRDKLLDFLKSFKDRKEVVKEEDIKAFFAGMKPKREPDGVYFCR